jgi:hypothetical protein
LEAGSDVHDAVAPVDTHEALAAEILCALQVPVETVYVKLREPHAGIVLQPRDRPALAAFQLAEDFVHRVPTERIAQAGENHVAGRRLWKSSK